MGHGGNIIAELVADHREVEEVFDRIRTLPPGDEARADLRDEITIELVRHSVAEEQYLYPAVRTYVEDGDRLADRELEDHAAVERLLKDLERAGPNGADFERLVVQLIDEVSAHIDDEENNLFPALAAACSPQELDDLGDRIRLAKDTAPTRPHPGAPTTPPANRVLAPGLGLVDRVRDLVTGRGKG